MAAYQIINEGEGVTIDAIVNEADRIYSKLRISKANTDAELDLFHEKMFEEHKKFAQSYPLVLKYLCQLKLYRSRAFKKYLVWLAEASKKAPTEEEWLERQANYVVYLYREVNRHYSQGDVTRIRDDTVKALKEERDNFKKELKKYEAKLEEDLKKYGKMNAEELAAFNKSLDKTFTEAPIYKSDVKPAANEAEKKINEVKLNKREVSADDFL